MCIVHDEVMSYEQVANPTIILEAVSGSELTYEIVIVKAENMFD
jgi:hypothetical protein